MIQRVVPVGDVSEAGSHMWGCLRRLLARCLARKRCGPKTREGRTQDNRLGVSLPQDSTASEPPRASILVEVHQPFGCNEARFKEFECAARSSSAREDWRCRLVGVSLADRDRKLRCLRFPRDRVTLPSRSVSALALCGRYRFANRLAGLLIRYVPRRRQLLWGIKSTVWWPSCISRS